jgi:hypothetical protein
MGREPMFRLITIDFSHKSPHFSLLSPTSPCELSEREVTSPYNLKVVGALDNYSLVFVIFISVILSYFDPFVVPFSHFINSPCQRQCELLPSVGVRRPSSVVR